MICFLQQWILQNYCYIKLQDIARYIHVSVVLFVFFLYRVILKFYQKSVLQYRYYDIINAVTQTIVKANLYHHITQSALSFNGGA